MCDFAYILGSLAAAQGFILAAIALTVTAIAVNSSFFGAPGAVVPFGFAVVSAFAGASALWLASSLLADPACAASGACSRAPVHPAAGSATKTFVPAPRWLSAAIVPPHNLTNSRQISVPSPKPFSEAVPSVDPRFPSPENSLAARSGSIPTPESATTVVQ